MRFCQRADSNWTPLSVVMTEGIPNHDIQPLRNARAAVSAVLSRGGMASGCRVKRSTHKYRQPWDNGKGPTKSTCTWLKRASGLAK